MKNLYKLPVAILSLNIGLGLGTTLAIAQEECGNPTVDTSQNITLPCIAIDGFLYQGKLTVIGSEEWKFDLNEFKTNACAWNPQTCVTVSLAPDRKKGISRAMEVTQPWEAKLPNLSLKGKTASTVLHYIPHSHPEDPDGYYWTLVKQLDSRDTSGFSDSYGTLAAYTPPSPHAGANRKLLAIYMVGSDLESGGSAATTDLQELIEGYQTLSDPSIDVIIAFGGANQDGWRGMKFADMTQIIEDSQDGIFGNLENYLYQEDRAHMGDKSSLTLFLQYVKEGYTDYTTRFLTLWDHGGAYGGFGNDENFDDDGLSLQEIDDSLTNGGLGQVDLIGFDACLMASAEVAPVVQNHANYLLASEELEPGHGWNWTAVIKEYAAKDEIVEVAKAIIDNYVDNNNYSADSVQEGKTLSVADLSQFNQVLTAFDAFAAAGITATSTTALIKASTQSRDYGKQSKADQRTSIDWKDFAQLTKGYLGSGDNEVLVQLLDNLITAIDNYVIYSNQDGSKPRSYGVSFGGLEAEAPPLSEAAKSFQTAFLAVKNGDTVAPAVTDQNSNTTADQWFNESSFTDEDSLFTEDDLTWWEDDQGTAKSSTAPRRPVPSFLQGERTAFVDFNHKLRAQATLADVDGIVAKFDDDHLTSVTTLFGNVMPLTFDEVTSNYFWVTAEVEAYPTDNAGYYFTPQWNQQWYTVKFDPAQETEWMPMMFQYRYKKDGQTYSYYSSEIDYIKAEMAKQINIDAKGELVAIAQDDQGNPIYAKDNQGNPINPIEWARLDIIVDANNQVVNHAIRTYKILYNGDENDMGQVQFDKISQSLQPGDVIAFYAQAFSLEGQDDLWLMNDRGFITFTQAPQFMVEELAFEDEQGQLLDYYSAMLGGDVAGNYTLTAPQPTQPVGTTTTTETETTPAEETTTPAAEESTTGDSTTTNEPAEFAGTLAAHNEWRQQVKVSALTWSTDLATLAQDWADTLKGRDCAFEHRPNNTAGENIYWASGFTPTPKQVIDSWGKEIADYDYATNTCATGKMCGHYTQLVWRDSSEVGCGKAQCDDGSILWVCNYNPPGNFIGQKPY